jgi:Leucine-rich repeat (LRR) protein
VAPIQRHHHKKWILPLIAFCVILAVGGSVWLYNKINPILEASEAQSDPAPVAAGMSVHLEEMEGTVSLTDSSLRELSVSRGLQLFDGNAIATHSDSYAYMSLDRMRATKLDEDSLVEIAQNGSHLELYLRKGNLFFNIERPLTEEETLTILSSTITIGVRGTSGVVRSGSGGQQQAGVYVLDGEIVLKINQTEITVHAGEIAEQLDTEIIVRELSESEIDPFVVEEIRKDTGLQEKIQNETSLSVALILGIQETSVPEETGNGIPVESIQIQGQEFSTSLETLDLNTFNLTDSDIEPLKYMKNLKTLVMSSGDVGVSDLSSLSSLTGLDTLYLSGNSIRDIHPLAALTNLTNLQLGHNSITDLSPLSELTNLNFLELSFNSISDLSPLSKMSHLTSLDLWDNNISDLAPLQGLTSLTYISLGENEISDISPLSSLTNLTNLVLAGNTVSDLSVLPKLSNLTILRMDGNSIADVSPLAELQSLSDLDLGFNSITDVSPLAELPNLSHLGLEHNSIIDIRPLSRLKSDTFLSLYDNPITDWSPVSHINQVSGRP